MSESESTVMIGFKRSAEPVRRRDPGGEMHRGKGSVNGGGRAEVEVGVAWQCKPSGSCTASN